MEMSPWRQTTTISENRASQHIDQGLLTFAMSNIHDRPQLIVICYVFSSTPFIFGQLVYVLGGKTLQDWWEKLTNPLKFYIFELNTSAACIHFLLRKIPHRISQKLEPFFWLMTLNSLVNPLIYLGKSFSKKMSSGIFETHSRAELTNTIHFFWDL